MIRDCYDRYLRLLGIGHRPTGLPGLRELVRAHILNVPFENVSKLLLFDHERKGRQATLEEFLDGLEHQDLGGTCYTSNPFCTNLLRELDYDAVLLGADMNNPNVHTSIRVHLDGIAYHVDVGNAAPFLEPILLDRLPHTIRRGSMHWVFDRAEDGRLEAKVFSNGEPVHGYRVSEVPHDLEFFRSIVVDSFERGRTFMSLLRLVRIFPEHTVELKDRTLRIHLGTETREHKINGMAELREVVDRDFQMPRCPVEEAVRILEEVNGIAFFGEKVEQSLFG